MLSKVTFYVAKSDVCGMLFALAVGVFVCVMKSTRAMGFIIINFTMDGCGRACVINSGELTSSAFFWQIPKCESTSYVISVCVLVQAELWLL